MGFITDLLRAFYDLPGLAKELSHRSAGRVAGALILISVVYGIATGAWYAITTSELVGILAEEAKAHVPAFTITQGRLSSDVQQPYIITGKVLRPELFLSIEEWVKRRFHKDPGDLRTAYNGLDIDKAFVFVLDTTGTYREHIKPEEYTASAILEADRAWVTSDRDSGGRQTREIIYANSAAQTLNFEPSKLSTAAVPEQTRRAILPGFAGASALLTLARFAFKALILGLIGWIAAKLAKKSLSFGQAYAIGVFAHAPIAAAMLLKVLVLPLPGIILLLLNIIYGVVPAFLAPEETTSSPVAPVS